MQPKDLKPAFNFAEREPLLQDHVLYVPIYYANHHADLFTSLSDYFGNHHPVYMECCTGNGDWIVQQAEQHQELNWIAVEQRFDRVRKIWSKLKNRGLCNLLIICGEAMTFTKNYLPGASIE